MEVLASFLLLRKHSLHSFNSGPQNVLADTKDRREAADFDLSKEQRITRFRPSASLSPSAVKP
jgi:hypothetical protein